MNVSATDLHYLELTELAHLLRTRSLSPVEVTRHELDRISGFDSHLASYAVVLEETALAEALRAEREIAGGRYRGALHGVPVGVKDLFWIKDVPTAAGTTIHSDFRPDRDATAVARLKQAGAVILGKLQMTEGAYSDHHPAIAAPRNPWDAEYWTGISSSGPAVATAAGLCYAALASDTGGSIRWPCAANGLTGIKPTWGRVSRFGMFELAPSMDHVGPIARSAADAAAVLEVIAGHDPSDPTSLAERRSRHIESREPLSALRIGLDPAWNTTSVNPEVQTTLAAAVEIFGELGTQIVELTAPDVSQAVVDWSPLCAVEAAVVHEATYPTRRTEYGPVLASVLEAGRAVSVLDHQKMLLRRMVLSGRFAELFESIDLLLTPVQPFAPLTLKDIQSLGEQPELILGLQQFTAPFDLTGNPTITLPAGFTQAGLPIGIQVVAPHLHEANLVRAGEAFQAATNWHRRRPSKEVDSTEIDRSRRRPPPEASASTGG